MLRLTARAILLNKNTGNILLIKYLDEYSPSTKEFTNGFWVLPGGGLEQYESFEDAIKREIYEETGISEVDVEDCLFTRMMGAELETIGNVLAYERYYLVETSETEINTNNLTDDEVDAIVKYKWWSVDELEETTDIILPPSLKALIGEALRDRGQPIDLTDSGQLLNHC